MKTPRGYALAIVFDPRFPHLPLAACTHRASQHQRLNLPGYQKGNLLRVADIAHEFLAEVAAQYPEHIAHPEQAALDPFNEIDYCVLHMFGKALTVWTQSERKANKLAEHMRDRLDRIGSDPTKSDDEYAHALEQLGRALAIAARYFFRCNIIRMSLTRYMQQECKVVAEAHRQAKEEYDGDY